MAKHETGTEQDWLAARRELLEAEKEQMRRGDELARRRRELPWVPVEKEYVFETADGRRTLADASDWIDNQRARWERLFDVVSEYLDERKEQG